MAGRDNRHMGEVALLSWSTHVAATKEIVAAPAPPHGTPYPHTLYALPLPLASRQLPVSTFLRCMPDTRCTTSITTSPHITQHMRHAISAPRKPLSPPVTSSDHARMARVQCMHDIALMSHAGSAYASLCMVHGPAELTVHCASEHILPLGLSQNCASTSLELLLRFAHQTPPNCTVHRNCARNL